MLMSIVITSGLSDSARETASRPSLAWPTTWSRSSALKIVSRTLRMNAESSTISTRNFLIGVAIARLRHGNDRAARLRSHKLFHRRDQLVFLNRLGQERRCAFLHRAITVLRARTGGNDHDRNPARRRVLSQLHHQFVPGHARHFEVRDNQVAAVLRYELSGFHSIGRQLYAVPVLFEHPAYEFAHADGVVRHDDYAFLLDTVDRFRRNRSTSNRRRPRRKNTCRAGVRLERPPLARFRSYHAVQVDQKDQTAIGSNGRSRKKFYAAEVLAQVLDHDFVFANHFFHNEADLPVACVCHHHAEIAVDWLKRRQSQIRVQANDFRYDVADLGQQLPANVLDLIGPQAANFLDDRQGQRKVCCTATHEERRRNDQREGHLERELCAQAVRALDINFAVERVQVGAHHIQPDAPARQFRPDRRGREARVEQHLARAASRQWFRSFRC